MEKLPGAPTVQAPISISRFFSDYGGGDGASDNINPSIIGILVACLQVSAALGSLIAGRLGDMIGRKKCARRGGFCYFDTAFIQALAPGFKTFVVGRTLPGLGVGFLSMTAPIIQTEIAATHRRGLMVGVEYTFLIGGYALSPWVGLTRLLLPDILPETPLWLARNGFTKECLQTVADLHTPNSNTEAYHVKQIILEIREAVRYEATLGQPTWREMLTRYCIMAQIDRPAQRHQRHHLILPTHDARQGGAQPEDDLTLHGSQFDPLRRRYDPHLVAGRIGGGRQPLLIRGDKLKSIVAHIYTRFLAYLRLGGFAC
ncbi:hypothetical protein MKZ38_009849 [Zalerion maritima]|uniref:Major facilitator superfamily (MFS) profile domain-containing protein n=1 Tax=Zalerion maritima TaxID=339359 RepID=A0AAD5RJV3_9PEZI|nr:hypothetical protein MKZ38_009849 [Zalerion maritima]